MVHISLAMSYLRITDNLATPSCSQTHHGHLTGTKVIVHGNVHMCCYSLSHRVLVLYKPCAISGCHAG